MLGRRYRIIRPLGRGGAATTFAVEDVLREETLALKLLAATSPSAVGAFRDEFARLRGLSYPNLCQVFDLGSELTAEGPLHFYTAELIEGSTLDVFAAEHPWSEAVGAFRGAVSALAFLHRLGLRHGDFKPKNIVVRPDGQGVLIDLGCAKTFDDPSDGTVSGTPSFMAPELLLSGTGDARADLYAVGLTLRSLGGDLDTDLEALAERLTRELPEMRPSDAYEVLEALGLVGVDLRIPFAPAPKFIGRRAELDLFDEHLDRLLASISGPRALVLRGPRGIGCSRLLLEMKWRSQHRCVVIDASDTGDAPLLSAIQLALGREVPPDLASILEALRELASSSQPVVITCDDTTAWADGDSPFVDVFLRSVEQDDRFLFICTRRGAPPPSTRGVSVVEVQPLSVEEVVQWVGDALDRRAIEHLHVLTGGSPAYLEVCLARLASGELDEADLLAETAWSGVIHAADLNALDDDGRSALGLLAVYGGKLTDEASERLELTRKSFDDLHRLGWLERDGFGWKLGRIADVQAVLGALDSILLISLHKRAAVDVSALLEENAHDDVTRSELTAELVRHLLHGGREDEAVALAEANEALYLHCPERWRRSGEALSTISRSTQGLLLAATIVKSGGHPERALEIVELVPAERSVEQQDALDELHASCLLTLGMTTGALAELETAIARTNVDENRARMKELMSRALLQRGVYKDAKLHALEALSLTDDPGVCALLHEDVGVAASYLGAADEAQGHFDEAMRLHARTERPRAKFRVLTYQAIEAFRRGRVESAIARYQEALKIAEAQGLSDLLANAALNVGTACQQYGDWGPALSSYERGLRIAVALGSVLTEITLRFNVANLYAEMGLFERATTAIAGVRHAAFEADLGYFDGATQAVLGEISLIEGDFESAEKALIAAKKAFSAHGTSREIHEVDLHLVNLRLARTDHRGASRALDAVETAIEGLDAADLALRVRLLRGKIALSQSQGSLAITVLEDALRRADDTGMRALRPQIELHLAEACEEQAAPELAASHRRSARRDLERIAASLPEHLRQPFWQHPQRRASMVQPTPEHHHSAPTELHRFLELNKRINSTLSIDQVLECALDSAIELTGAERGFVLLADVDETAARTLKVPIARNLDREKIGRSHLKFSRSIAEEVIVTGKPVVTVDAEDDTRFRGNESVHAMRLKSVIAVPITSPSGVLGALYLDNRFQRGRFAQSDLDHLIAFGDQVAIAMQNARLHMALERRTAALEAEHKKVERLLRGQAREIDRLHDEVRTRQEILEYRYDYSNIIGRGKAMRRLLATLDRVIDSSLSVLIQGESGTGKELIARAIHFNSERRKSRFVGINCAALPAPLLESELFGYKRGAFTGADRDREGLLVAARGGTLFLDEVGEMPKPMQATLLRALQEREVRPLGSDEAFPVNIRLICATNRTLADEVDAGRFREDLFYRIAVVEVVVPPLRERTEDIHLLAQTILARLASNAGTDDTPRLSSDAHGALMGHPFPGNVRQLENILARGFIMAGGEEIKRQDLGLSHRAPRAAPVARDRAEFEEEEERRILTALSTTRWNVAEVSRQLGIPRNTLYRKLQKYRITRPDRSTL